MAVGHTMLVIAYTMLKNSRSYQDLGGNYLEQLNKDQLQRYLVKRLHKTRAHGHCSAGDRTSLTIYFRRRISHHRSEISRFSGGTVVLQLENVVRVFACLTPGGPR